MHPQIKAVIITCIDYRIQSVVDNWIKDNNYTGGFDRISIAGVTKNMVKPIQTRLRATLLRELGLSIKLHNPQKIILMDHEDCGAFREDNTISENASFNEDREIHIRFLSDAKKMLKKYYPEKEIETYYVKLSGEIERN